MQEVVIFHKRNICSFFDDFFRAAWVFLLFGRHDDFFHMHLLRGGVNALHADSRRNRNIALLVYFQKPRREVRNIVKDFACRKEIQLQIFARSLFAREMLGKQAYFLGSSAAFVLCVGIGINAPSAFFDEFLHSLPCADCALVVVYAIGVALPQSFARNAFNAAPIYLQARRENQKVVVYDAVFQGHYFVFVGIDADDAVFYPVDSAWHAVGLFFVNFVGGIYARSDEGEARLVVMQVARVNDCDIRICKKPLQARSHADARRAAADNHDFSVCVA